MQNPDTGYLEPLDSALVQQKIAEGRCVLRVGQEVEMMNGTFRIAALGRKFVKLEGMPGTHIEEG